MRFAASGVNFAPPTCNTLRLLRSGCSTGAMASHANASGGTSAHNVIRSRATSVKLVDGVGSGHSTIVLPDHNTPRIPGELMVKLWETGNTTKNLVSGVSSQIRADSRTEYR